MMADGVKKALTEVEGKGAVAGGRNPSLQERKGSYRAFTWQMEREADRDLTHAAYGIVVSVAI